MMTGSDKPVPLGIVRAIRQCWQGLVGVVGVISLPLVRGCTPTKYLTPQRFDYGYALILPGIEGTSHLNANIAKGLVDGGWPGAIEVYDWTAGSVLLFLMTLLAVNRNKREACKIAARITEYQARYPDRPVHIIGHSGGGGVAILTLEALPADHSITSAILLAAAISPGYDLRPALRRTRQGVWNFYSHYDVGFLKAGTLLLGTIDRRHTSAAGAVGFRVPEGLEADDHQLYASKLRQQSYSRKMAESGHSGGHLGWASRRFVSEWLCPILSSSMALDHLR
jgi:hypothetical protein